MTILVDANLLIYAYNRTAAQHKAARAWLEVQLVGSSPVGLPWSSLLAFLRVTTHPRVLARPADMEEAWQQVRRWLSADVAWIPQPTEQHVDVFGRFLGVPGIRGNLIHDADLAALAIEHGLTLCSTDGDFARFPELISAGRTRWRRKDA